MAKFSLDSFLDTNVIIYIAPVLVIVSSLFHIFSSVPATHGFGQIEVLAAFIIIGYYLWDKIAEIYPADKIGKKRIEAVACIVGSIFFALIPLAPLLSWQFYNLNRASDDVNHSKTIMIAVATIWLGCGVMFLSSYQLAAERMTAAQQGIPESSMPTPSSMQ